MATSAFIYSRVSVTVIVEELKQALREIAKGTQLKAVIVDDEFATIDVPPFTNWVILQDALKEAPELHDDLFECLSGLEHNPDFAPPIETLTTAIEKLKVIPTESQKSALDLYTQWEHLLCRLSNFLSDLGFEVECVATKPTFESEQLPFLCLVDYQMIHEEESGETAAMLFEHLMKAAATRQRPPPFVILMSKALSEADVGKWIPLAERAGFFRFNYGFLNKEQFLDSPAYLAYPLLHFVKHEHLSRAYFLQMNSLVDEAQDIARKVSRQLFQVTPPEALLFKDQVFKEGSSLSSELSNLFAELFSREIKASPNVVARMAELERVITDEGVPVPYRQQRSALHELYADLLHEKCQGTDNEPAFGDIYEDALGKYFLILSQECDLAAGDGRERKIDRVVAIEGELKSAVPEHTSETIVVKPFIVDNQRIWLCWDLGRPMVFPLLEFAQTPTGSVEGVPAPAQLVLRKKWRLRFAEAEDIQHKFATRMTRVALNIMPEFVHVHTFQCCKNDQIIDGAPPVFIYEVQKSKRVALAPESQAACCALDDGRFMSNALIAKLSVFVSHETFRQELEREDLLALGQGSELLLSKATQDFKRGKRPWKGLT
jgi:hypothetical protein